MSCMLLSSRHISTVAHFVTRLLNAGYSAHGFEAPYSLHDALYQCHGNIYDYSEKAVFVALYRKNLIAYNSRYRDASISVDFPEMTEPAFELPMKEWCNNDKAGWWKITPEHVKMLKLLDCYVYQIEEDATRNDELTKAMIELKRIYASFIASNNAIYSGSEWVI